MPLAMFFVKQVLLVAGGSNATASEVLASTELYSPSTKQWTKQEDFPV